MERVEVLKNAESMVSEWAKPFICPLTRDTKVLAEVLDFRLRHSNYNDGVILTSTFCNDCDVNGVKSWVTLFAVTAGIKMANSPNAEFHCPTCKTKIVPTPPPPADKDRCDLDTVRVPRELSYAEVHVLQKQLEADRIQIEDLQRVVKLQDEYIQKMKDREILVYARTYTHCLKRKFEEGEQIRLMKMSSTYPDAFRLMAKDEVNASRNQQQL